MSVARIGRAGNARCARTERPARRTQIERGPEPAGGVAYAATLHGDPGGSCHGCTHVMSSSW